MKLLAAALTVSAVLMVFGLEVCASATAWGAVPHSTITLAQVGVTAEEAAAIIQARTGGRILAVKRIRSQGRILYRIKVLTPKGEVRIFYVDAATGAM